MHSNRDIVITSGATRIFFIYLEWDSIFFNKPSYLLDMTRSVFGSRCGDDGLAASIAERLQGGFVTAKVDTKTDYSVIKLLEDSGFYYIDTEVALEKCDKSSVPEIKNAENVSIEKLEDNEGLPYEELGEAFALTRFHTDPHIDDKLADALWINYIRNYQVSASKHMFVAKTDGEVTGAILVNIDDRIANLFFVAVRKGYRGSGIGQALIGHVSDYFSDYTLKTGTQVKNVGALNFYIKNGFSKIDQTSTVLHRWDDD